MAQEGRASNIATLVAATFGVVTAIGGFIYSAAVVQVKVADNTRDIESNKQWIEHHGASDKQGAEKMQSDLAKLRDDVHELLGRFKEQDEGRKR